MARGTTTSKPAHLACPLSGACAFSRSALIPLGFASAQHLDLSKPPGMDLRQKKKSSDFLAEIVYLFCGQRHKYDRMCRDFTRRFCDRKTYS